MQTIIGWGASALEQSYSFEPTRQILEPVTALARVAALKYKQPGTKINIHNHSITYVQPWIFQWAQRRGPGCSHEDLHNLFHPLVLCKKWYSPNNMEFMKVLHDGCVEGLELFARTYSVKSPLTSHAMLYYASILRDPVMLDKVYEEIIKNPLYEIFNSFWNEEQLELLSRTYSQIDAAYKENYSDELEEYMNSFEAIILAKERRAFSLVTKTMAGDGIGKEKIDCFAEL